MEKLDKKFIIHLSKSVRNLISITHFEIYI